MNLVPCVHCGTAIEERDSPVMSGESICDDCFDPEAVEILNRPDDDMGYLDPVTGYVLEDEVYSTRMAFFSVWDDR